MVLLIGARQIVKESAWRGGEPVGLWMKGAYRKHTRIIC